MLVSLRVLQSNKPYLLSRNNVYRNEGIAFFFYGALFEKLGVPRGSKHLTFRSLSATDITWDMVPRKEGNSLIRDKSA